MFGSLFVVGGEGIIGSGFLIMLGIGMVNGGFGSVGVCVNVIMFIGGSNSL